jgi:hypothetical protein
LLAFGALCYIARRFRGSHLQGTFSFMATLTQPEITQLLAAWSDGDPSALEQLVPLVQAELHRIAKRYIGRGNAGQLLSNYPIIQLSNYPRAAWRIELDALPAAAEGRAGRSAQFLRNRADGA